VQQVGAKKRAQQTQLQERVELGDGSGMYLRTRQAEIPVSRHRLGRWQTGIPIVECTESQADISS